MISRPFVKAAIAALVTVALLAPSLVAAQSSAGELPEPMFRIPGTPPEPDRSKRQTGLTERTFNILSSIFEDIGEERFAEARDRLVALGQTRRLSDYESASIHRYLGFVNAMLENNDVAIREMTIALDAEVLGHQETQDTMLQLAQLHAMGDNWDAVLRIMPRYLYWADKPTADALMLMTYAYVQKENFRETIKWANRTLDVSTQPRENVLQILLWAHFELKEFEPAADVLARLIANWPDKVDYWEQLAGILMELGREEQSLAVYSVAYQKGLLKTEAKINNLVSYYLYRQAPYQAARILDKAIDDGIVEPTQKNLELLSQAYQMAQENEEAIEALQRAAALSDDGELFVREAQLHAATDNWDGVQRAAQNAVRKGGLKNPGRAWMMVGMAAYERGENAEALRALREAAKHEDSRRNAQQWINYINNQIRTERALREGA